MYTRFIQGYQVMINEVLGLVDRRPQNGCSGQDDYRMITVVAEEAPNILRTLGLEKESK